MNGQKRADIKKDATVDVVKKEHQRSGQLTRGVVRDILTRSPTHPHGIKVRLQSGEVGRIKAVITTAKPAQDVE